MVRFVTVRSTEAVIREARFLEQEVSTGISGNSRGENGQSQRTEK